MIFGNQVDQVMDESNKLSVALNISPFYPIV